MTEEQSEKISDGIEKFVEAIMHSIRKFSEDAPHEAASLFSEYSDNGIQITWQFRRKDCTLVLEFELYDELESTCHEGITKH